MIENILLVLLVLLLSAKIIGALFERMGLDSTIGELLTGVIFGPSLLNMVHASQIETFAVIGSVLILFVAGLKQQDVEDITKDKPSIQLGLLLLFITAIVMTVFFLFVAPLLGTTVTLFQALVLALVFSVVDLGVPAKILIAKGLINKPVGRVAIRASIINIIAGLLLFTVLTLFINPTLTSILWKILGIVLFVGIAVGLVIFLAKISKFVMRLHVEEAEFSLSIILVLALAYFSDLIGFSVVLGAFIAGILVARLPFSETRSFSDKIKSLSFGLFVPLFFVWFGLEIHMSEILTHLALAVLIFIVYAATRFIVTYVHLKRNKMKMPTLISASMLSVDVESLVMVIVAMQLAVFATDLPLTLFAPSVFFSTLGIVVLVSLLTKRQKAVA